MPAFNPVVASFSFLDAPDIVSSLHDFARDRSLILSFFANGWKAFGEWIAQPTVYAVVIAWVVTFMIIVVLGNLLGFSPIGVVAGSSAAAFQAWMYGGFTPAAGVFATLTSIGMLGLLMPVVVIFAAFVASIIALIVWACGAGS